MSQPDPSADPIHLAAPASKDASKRLVCCLMVMLFSGGIGAFYAFVSIGVATVPKGRENEMLFAWIAGGLLLGAVSSSLAWSRPMSQAILAAALGGTVSFAVCFILAGMLFGTGNQPDAKTVDALASGACGGVAGAIFGVVVGLATCGIRSIQTSKSR